MKKRNNNTEYTIDLAKVTSRVFSDNEETQKVIEQQIRSEGLSIKPDENGIKISLK